MDASEQAWQKLANYLMRAPFPPMIFMYTPYEIKNESEKCTTDHQDINWFNAMMSPLARSTKIEICCSDAPVEWQKARVANHDIRDLLYWIETHHYRVESIIPEFHGGDHHVQTVFRPQLATLPKCPENHIPFAAK